MADGFYNIVLKPDEMTEKAATSLAQTYVAHSADGYCLESGKVFPHITLTQFRTTDDEVKNAIAAKVEKMNFSVPEIRLLSFVARFATIENRKYFWLGLSVSKSMELQSLQTQCHHLLEGFGLKPLNPSLDLYNPHLTLGRIRTTSPIPNMIIPNYFLMDGAIGAWTVAIGHSDKNGQFLGKL